MVLGAEFGHAILAGRSCCVTHFVRGECCVMSYGSCDWTDVGRSIVSQTGGTQQVAHRLSVAASNLPGFLLVEFATNYPRAPSTKSERRNGLHSPITLWYGTALLQSLMHLIAAPAADALWEA